MKILPLRMLVCIGISLIIGVLCLLQVVSDLNWMPADVFRILHMPAISLAGLLVHGETAWDVLPYTVVLQWVVLGILAGSVSLVCKRKRLR